VDLGLWKSPLIYKFGFIVISLMIIPLIAIIVFLVRKTRNILMIPCLFVIHKLANRYLIKERIRYGSKRNNDKIK
jgi:hypothetical protein